MKLLLFLLVLLSTLTSAAAAPALVWKSPSASTTTLHHTDPISITDILPAQGVVFLLKRLSNGQDALTTVAPLLTQTAALPATNHYHFVHGNVVHGSSSSSRLTEVTLEEYRNLPQYIEQLKSMTSSSSSSSSKSKKRAHELESAQLLLVTVDMEQQQQQQHTDNNNTALLDETIAQAIIHNQYHSVVLTAVRSIEEIQREREMDMHHRMRMQQEAGRQQSKQRRRLEEQEGNEQQQNNNNQNNQNQYMVLVHMTPNILSGILFTLLFATITLIGITCMGAIQGQDVYVKKMPAIGREA